MRTIVLSKRGRDPLKHVVDSYVSGLVKNADKGSTFQNRAKFFSWLPPALLSRALIALNYDSLLFENKGRIISNVSFQRHGDSLHVFSVFINPKNRSTSALFRDINEFLDYAKSVKGVTKVRLGKGENHASVTILKYLKRREHDKGIKVLSDGWVELASK